MNNEVNIKSSSLTKQVYNIIKELYPKEPIKQEEKIKINGKVLFLDIYLPKLKLAFECNGAQHFKFNKFFHKDIWSLRQQRQNDSLKRSFCNELNITLVDVNFNEKIDRKLIEDKIMLALKEGSND